MTARWFRRLALGLGIVFVLGLLLSSLDLRPNLRRLDVQVLSGPNGGQYQQLVAQLATAAAVDGGRIRNVATEGTVDNLARLTAARDRCDVQFALVQDGSEWPPGLELLGRLPRAESVLFLGRDADRYQRLSELAGLRIGIGPPGSGTNRLAREIFSSELLAGLPVQLQDHPLDEQLAQLQSGALDLGMFVMDEDAPLLVDAVRRRGLQMLDIPQADVIARKLPRVRAGRIGAGQYDPVRLLPAADKTVLRVETLVVGNGCARRSAEVSLLTLLAREFPDFVRRNQDLPNRTGLPLTANARTFFATGGPDLATQHAPWAVDLMPLENWVYLVTAFSVLLNLGTLWSNFRLWRYDDARVRLERRLEHAFFRGLEPHELAALAPTDQHLQPSHRDEVRHLLAELEALAERCRKQSVGWVPDMGQEMQYRHAERLIQDWVHALRGFRSRVDATVAAKDAIS